MIDPAIRAIVTDIEGTTTPIAFVRTVLFPYAQSHLDDFLNAHGGRPDITALLDDVRRLAPGQEPATALQAWMRDDAKITPLKTLQGLIWEHGYLSGAIRSPIYADVPPRLQAWRDEGKDLFVYSSGSIAAQRLLFGFSDAGDLRPHFRDYFDTTIGGKRAVESYRAIAARIGLDAEAILFLSDVEEELDAAESAGWRTTQLVRAEDGTLPSAHHPIAMDFTRITA